MTKQESIKLLTEMQHNCYKDTSTDPKRFMKGDALEIAIECIEKQIPKKPIAEEGKMWICPNCANNLLWIWKEYPTKKTDLNEGLPFCLSCGQAIDWSDDNER